jgi:hypothetical protein
MPFEICLPGAKNGKINRALVLLPIFVPGSISVTTADQVRANSSVPIQTVNFSRSPFEVQYNGSTPTFTLPLALLQGVGALFDAYVSASAPATGFIYNTMYGRRIVDAPSPCGVNCSFSQTFIGPGYNCRDIDFTRNDEPGNPFCTKSYSGYGACGGYFDPFLDNAFDVNWYMASNSSGDICQEHPGDYSCSAVEPWMERKSWVLYQYLLPEYRSSQTDQGTNSTAILDDAWEGHVFVCESYNATYTLKRTYKLQ